jgi:hypothetical protein
MARILLQIASQPCRTTFSALRKNHAASCGRLFRLARIAARIKMIESLKFSIDFRIIRSPNFRLDPPPAATAWRVFYSAAKASINASTSARRHRLCLPTLTARNCLVLCKFSIVSIDTCKSSATCSAVKTKGVEVFIGMVALVLNVAIGDNYSRE